MYILIKVHRSILAKVHRCIPSRSHVTIGTGLSRLCRKGWNGESSKKGGTTRGGGTLHEPTLATIQYTSTSTGTVHTSTQLLIKQHNQSNFTAMAVRLKR